MLKRPDLTIGIISDTHLPYRMSKLPPIVLNVFQGVDFVLHAGDVDEIELLAPLREIAPLYAVRGNIHLADFSSGGKNLPSQVTLTLGAYRVVVTHGHRSGLMEWLLKGPEIILSKFLQSKGQSHIINGQIARRLNKLHPEADIVVFGHTHAVYSQRIGKTLFFNPGSVVPTKNRMTSVGLLHLWPHKIVSQIVPLDQIENRRARLHTWISPSKQSPN